MQLLKIKLENFRNYHEKEFEFDEGMTLIVGDNASGKTNLLEAVNLLATGKSFRAQKIEEMILFGKELARLTGLVSNQSESESEQETLLEILLTKGEIQGKRVAKRHYSVDGASKRLSDFSGRLVGVIFRPEDLQIILGSPSIRRNFLDSALVQVDREYARSLVSYEKALSRRNRILDMVRDEGAPRTQLTFWDQLLIKHGKVLTEKRGELFDYINSFESEVDSFFAEYDRSTISEKRLQQYSREEIAAGYTLVGPHKDDFSIVASNHTRSLTSKHQVSRNLALFGSRGEQRLAVLWLKLAELFYVTNKIKEKPILILDDILSELDRDHRSEVMKVVPKHQTIVTTTDLSLIESSLRSRYSLIEIKKADV